LPWTKSTGSRPRASYLAIHEATLRRLNPELSARVRCSHVIRIDAIARLEPWFHGEQKIVMRDGATLLWTRRFRHTLPKH
jgi:DNA-binding LytR/AlgR family response regulator